MMTSHEVLRVYEDMVGLTDQMLAAARDGDWDRLVLLEQRCAAHVQTLKHGEPPQALQGESRQKKVALIRKMLDDDRQIRDLTTPWMAQLAALINHTGAERRLSTAYAQA